MTHEFEQISTKLQHVSTELHFIKATLNNLELVQVAQEDQKHFGWSRFTGDAIREFKLRAEALELEIAELTSKQENLYKTTFGVQAGN